MQHLSARSAHHLAAGLLAGLLLGACSSGGGGGPAGRLSFSTGELQVEEDAGTLSIQVVLEAPEDGLPEDVTVLVSDAGTGDATPGDDYAPFAPQELLFPAGSPDGAQQALELTLVDDGLVEGADETIHLQLSEPVGAGLGKPRLLELTVVDAHAATLRFASGATSSVDEQTQDHPVLVELVLPVGVSLGVEVNALVSDSGTGNATSGSDYAAFAPRTVAFAAGSASGSTSSAAVVQVLDDSVPENDEGVVLALSQPSPGALLGVSPQHELVILDDDTGSLPFLLVTEGPSGTDTTLDHEDALALGTQAVGAGPNAGTLVRLTNLGQQSLSLGAPELAGDHPDDFAVEIESLSAPPPDDSDEALALGTDLVAPFVAASDAALDDPALGLALELDVPALEHLEALTTVRLHGFPLPGQGGVTLALRRLPLPLAPAAVLAVDGVPQPGGLRAALDGLTLWRGSVLERPGSRLFLALGPDGAQGFVELPDTPDRLVHVLTEAGRDGAAPRVRVALEGQLAALGRERVAPVCDGLRVPPGASPAPAEPDTPGVAALTAADCRLALETDWQLTQKLGSTGAVTTYITQLVAAVSDRYLIDVQATLSIAYLGVYSGPGDPWSTPDGPGSTSDMLDEFRNAWNASGWPVAADLAHFVSGASLGGGIAYLDVLCNQSFGYGVSGNINGNIDWSSWTGQKGSFTWDFVVVAHELGHNFGTGHTHSYCPPLDQCASNCNTTIVCSQGTIMSYCHTCAGGMNNIRLEFHPVVADVIRAEINRSCLGDSALAGGDWVQYLVRFNPLGPSGARSADLELDHGATNHPSPFRLLLSGTAGN